jgi:hypothetical protein
MRDTPAFLRPKKVKRFSARALIPTHALARARVGGRFGMAITQDHGANRHSCIPKSQAGISDVFEDAEQHDAAEFALWEQVRVNIDTFEFGRPLDKIRRNINGTGR